MVWYDYFLNETMKVKSITGIDEFGDETFSAEVSIKCHIIDREDFIETRSGEREQHKHLVIAKVEMKLGDIVQLRGIGPWITIKKVQHERSPWDKVSTWRAYV